jgi:hypothetical protein
MKKFGLALACFGMFLVTCDGHGENPFAESNPSSQLSKNPGSTKQLHLSNQPSQSSCDEGSRLDELKIRRLAVMLEAQPTYNENAQSEGREYLVGTWIALAIVADALAHRVGGAASVDWDHQRGIDPQVRKGCLGKHR